MKSFKKSLIIISLTALLICAFSLVTSAAYSGTCGKNLTWTLDDAGTLTISGIGDMTNYSYDRARVNSPWWSIKEKIIKVFVEENVTSIGKYAFCGCINISTVNFGDSVETINDYAFYYCTSLNQLTIPGNIRIIGECSFEGCKGLKHLTICEGVETIENSAFLNCIQLENLIIPNSVTSIGGTQYYTNYGTFSGCVALKSAIIGNGVTTIGVGTFYGCKELKKVEFGNSVTDIESYSFQDCTSLSFMNIPVSVKRIDKNAFYGCSLSIYYPGSTSQWACVENPSCYAAICRYKNGEIDFRFTVKPSLDNYDIVCDIDFATFFECDYLISSIKYPKTFTFKEIVNKDFVDNIVDSQYSDDEYNYITVISTYSYDGERTESITGYTPYEIVFTVSETCPIGTYTLTFGDDTIAIGDADYTLVMDGIDVFVPDTLTIYGDDEISSDAQYTVRGVNTPVVPVIWSVDDENVATISEDGVLTPIVNGTVVITATYTENDTIFATKTVTVKDNDVTGIDIIGSDVVYDGEKYYAKIYPENLNSKKVKWSVDNTEVATITDDGVLTAVGAGTVKVKATVNDATAFSKEMTVTIPSINAVIDTLSSDVGTWDKEFVPYERNYTITVSKDTTSISLTGSFTGGSLKCNTTTMLNGRARTITLDSDVTTLTLARANVEGKNDSSYTVTVVKSVTYITANVSVVNGKYHFEVDTIALPEGYESASVVVAVYDENGTFVTMQTKPVTSDDTTATFDFDVEDVYSYQVMLFDALGNMKPLSTNVKKQI